MKRLLTALGFATTLSVAWLACHAESTTESAPLERQAPLRGVPEAIALFKGIPQHGVELGNPDAETTLVELSDLQCPFCRRFSADVLPTLVERFIRPGKVRLVLRTLTFLGEDSKRAARVAQAAGRQNKLWQFTAIFFENQGKENSGYATDDFLLKIASAIPGLDTDKAMREQRSEPVSAELAGAEAVAKKFSIHSVPAFLVGKTSGASLRELKAPAGDAERFAADLEEAIRRG